MVLARLGQAVNVALYASAMLFCELLRREVSSRAVADLPRLRRLVCYGGSHLRHALRSSHLAHL